MNLYEFKQILSQQEKLSFFLPDGKQIPSHFHITELGVVSKNFIDCGGTIREEKYITFQIWVFADLYHRLKPSKLMDIIKKAENIIDNELLEIEVEYQSDTIGRYGLIWDDGKLQLLSKQTDCMAKEACGLSVGKIKVDLASLKKNAECSPYSNCC